MAGGDTLGILHVRSSGGEFTQATHQMVLTLAEHIALLLSNLYLRDTLRQQSIRDPLTGLFNRRFREETLAREVARARRAKSPLGVIMLDIDHFKCFNDTHGHAAGDAVLKALGGFLLEHVRGGDVPCRYGGEEFALILPGAVPADAAQRAEELRSKRRACAPAWPGRPWGRLPCH